MKVLFVSFFINNSHFIKSLSQSLKRHLSDIEHQLLVMNDAPDDHDNYLQLVEQLNGDSNFKQNIKTEAIKNSCLYFEIPQAIHIKNRPNHSSFRHSENFNFTISNINSIVDDFEQYDFLCFIDSDVILLDNPNLEKEIKDYDMIFPVIKYNHNGKMFYYPHIGLLFINLRTVTNFLEMDGSITGVDTGSQLSEFLKQNPHYNNKKLFQFEEMHTWGQPDEVDLWMNKKFLHVRGGSSFGTGSSLHRNQSLVNDYINRLRDISETYKINYWRL